MIKRARSMGLLEPKEEIHTHRGFYESHEHSTKYKTFKELDYEDIYQEENDEDLEKISKPRKQVKKVGGFNTYQTSELLDDVMTPDTRSTGKNKSKSFAAKIEEARNEEREVNLEHMKTRRRGRKYDSDIKEEYTLISSVQNKTGGRKRRS